MFRNWRLTGLAVCLALGLAWGFYVWGWRVHLPPRPAAAALPASASELLAPFHRDSLELTVGPHDQLNYRVGMQAGATLVYSWSTGHNGEVLSGEFPGQKTGSAREGHGAFEAQSSGWYHWRWTNQSGNSIKIHVKLSGYYELPYDR